LTVCLIVPQSIFRILFHKKSIKEHELTCYWVSFQPCCSAFVCTLDFLLFHSHIIGKAVLPLGCMYNRPVPNCCFIKSSKFRAHILSIQFSEELRPSSKETTIHPIITNAGNSMNIMINIANICKNTGIIIVIILKMTIVYSILEKTIVISRNTIN